eukprot:SAG11_NODE_9947_length_867_cov_0.886719_1_plen_131_part_00
MPLAHIPPQPRPGYVPPQSKLAPGSWPKAPAGSAPVDKQLICRDCKQGFTWTAGQQTWYLEKGLTNPPGRCKPCIEKAPKKAVPPVAAGAAAAAAAAAYSATAAYGAYGYAGGYGAPAMGHNTVNRHQPY